MIARTWPLIATLGASLLVGCLSNHESKRPLRPRYRLSVKRSLRNAIDDRGDQVLRLVRQRSSRNGDILIYQTRWSGVEDITQVLLPLIQARHGPEARILPHGESGKIIVRIPPDHREPGGVQAPPTPPR